jgi:hypothetical protein
MGNFLKSHIGSISNKGTTPQAATVAACAFCEPLWTFLEPFVGIFEETTV